VVPGNVVYLDDLLVHAPDFELAFENLHQVFHAIQGLRLHPKKFNLYETKFLGHVVGAEGVATDPANVEAVKKWLAGSPKCQFSQTRRVLPMFCLQRRHPSPAPRVEKGREFNWEDSESSGLLQPCLELS